MRTKRLQYLFLTISAVLLLVMLILSRNAGISCDEVLHYNHSVSVLNYFKTHGTDQSALNTPVSHLKYYGQSFDNLATILIQWLNIGDIYSFRHIMSTLAGWLAIFVTAMMAAWLSGYRTGIIVLLLFSVSPTFLGHAQNNLKDIPFALSYISGIFFTLRLLSSVEKPRWTDIMLLVLSIGFSISIRAGGLVLVCYLFLFWFLFFLKKKMMREDIVPGVAVRSLVLIFLISFAAFFLGILLWPFVLQHPFRNILESYNAMAHFPATFRQIFEGKNEWSDFMPWYYLPESMAITIPLLILAGFIIFLMFSAKVCRSEKSLKYGLLFFTLLFPVIFVISQRSNLYSSWRQFLFIYPVLILLTAEGFNFLFEYLKKTWQKLTMTLILALAAIHPVKYMISNPSFFYIYYNQLTGGLKGAYGNFETDYYYTGQTEASEWLIKYLEEKKLDSVTVGATFSVSWQFRNHPEVKTIYFRNEERSMSDWDFAIITNRYIPVRELKTREWPPGNTIHAIYADGIPVCAVLERETHADFYGYKALEEGRNDDAVRFFEKALEVNDKDEMIFYNFARALYNRGDTVKADSLLFKGLDINPDFEPILMFLGNIEKARKDTIESERYYNKVLGVNRKYCEAYTGLADLYREKDVPGARQLLWTCLKMNPGYKPAIKALAETYAKTNPEIAEKYRKLLDDIK